jgi:peroxiredoxin
VDKENISNQLCKPGDICPDLALLNLKGERVHLSDYWQERPTIFAFIRHFGCPHCRVQLAHLNRAYPEILDLGAQVVAIGMGDQAKSNQFHQALRLKFPLLADEAEEAYEEYGLLLGAKTLKNNFNSFLRDAPLAVSLLTRKEYGEFVFGGNEYRMGGTFIVDTDGRAVYIHRDSDSADGAPLERVLEIVRSLQGRDLDARAS